MIESVAAAAARLRAGEVVAYPTETVYGLGCDARSAAALERLRTLKGRPAELGLSVLLPDAAALADWVETDAAGKLPGAVPAWIEAHWPGPLTLVLPVPADSPLAGVATPLGVGFRCSPQPTARALARASGVPLVSTSCNAHGQPPCVTAAQVEAAFGPALPIAGGEDAPGRPPSTVVAVDAQGTARVLRAGPIEV